MDPKIGVVLTVIVPLIVGALLGIPSETDVAKSIVENIQEQIDPDSPACQVGQTTLSVLELLEIAILVLSLAPIFVAAMKALA